SWWTFTSPTHTAFLTWYFMPLSAEPFAGFAGAVPVPETVSFGTGYRTNVTSTFLAQSCIGGFGLFRVLGGRGGVARWAGRPRGAAGRRATGSRGPFGSRGSVAAGAAGDTGATGPATSAGGGMSWK